MSRYQTIGNVSVAVAALIVVVPLHALLWSYARKYSNGYEWAMPAASIVIPLWLLLMVALLCVTASDGFDWLPLGRSSLHVLMVAASLALALLSFVLVASYIRPGFVPRGLFYAPLILVLVGTMGLVVASLNPQLGIAPQLFRWPWTIVAGLTLVTGVGGGGYWIATTGISTVAQSVLRRLNAPSSADVLAQIAAFDPQANFHDLLGFTSRYATAEIRAAATARLRSSPTYLDRLAEELQNGNVEPAVEFLYNATLTPAEQARLAGPARAAMQRWVARMPAQNYTTKQRYRELRRWGTEMLRVLPEKFSGTRVDFTEVTADFNER